MILLSIKISPVKIIQVRNMNMLQNKTKPGNINKICAFQQ